MGTVSTRLIIFLTMQGIPKLQIKIQKPNEFRIKVAGVMSTVEITEINSCKPGLHMHLNEHDFHNW